MDVWIHRLRSAKAGIRATAEEKLIQLGSSAVSPLMDLPDPVTRYRAVWVLGKIKDSAAFDAILALTNDPDEGVRYDAVLALAELGNERAIPFLLGFFVTQSDDVATSSAAGAGLTRFGHTALPFLNSLLDQVQENKKAEIRYVIDSITHP